jgi:hypothetical protein
VGTYHEVKAIGLRNVRLANTGIFASSEQDYHFLKKKVGVGNY